MTTEMVTTPAAQHGPLPEAPVGKAARGDPQLRTQQRAGDLHASLHQDMYREAYKAGMSFSAWLEQEDPSDQYDGELARMDAFERQLMIAGIKVRSDRRLGIAADKVDRFYTATGTSAILLPEFMARVYRLAASGGLPYAERFYMSSSPVSDVLHPDFIAAEMRAKKLQPSILDVLVALRTGIDSDIYKAFYVTDDEDERTLRRVAEGAEVPTAILTGGDHSINLKKYGRALEVSYEVVRRMPIDRLAFHLSQLAYQAEKDKAKTGIDVLINGDGNSGTSATASTISTLSGGTADQIDAEPLLDFLLLFEDPYRPTVVVGQREGIVELLTVDLGSANLPLFMGMLNPDWMGGLTMPEPIMPFAVYARSYLPTKKLVAVDGTKALEMVFEVGADLTETDKIIKSQVDVIVMTEAVGFCVLDQRATRILDWGN